VTIPVVANPTVAVPHLQVPFALALDGSASVVEQDTATEIAQCVQVLLATSKGSRSYVPDYGVEDPTFVGPDVSAITQAIAEYEPRADATVSVGTPDRQLQVTVTVGGGQ
jgi:phage baseplate assembly protein W